MELLAIKDLFARVRESWRPYFEERMIIKKHDADLRERIDEAHREWVDAQNFFNYVSEPDLVDYASYMLQAAESKYIYLLNIAKRNERR